MIGNRQLYKIANSLIKEYFKNGKMPSFNIFMSELISRISDINIGLPYTSSIPEEDYIVNKRSITNVDKLNKVYDAIKNDISLISEDVIELLSTIISDIQYFRSFDKRLKNLAINYINENIDNKKEIMFNDCKNIDLNNTTALVNFDAGAVTLQDDDDNIEVFKPSSVSIESNFDVNNILPPENLIDHDVNSSYICSIINNRNVNDVYIDIVFNFNEDVNISFIELANISPCDLKVNVFINESEIKSFNTTYLNNGIVHFDTITTNKVSLRVKPESCIVSSDNINSSESNLFYIAIENILFMNRPKVNSGKIRIDNITNDGKPVVPFKFTPKENVPNTTISNWKYSFDGENWKMISDYDKMHEQENSPYSNTVEIPEFKADTYTIDNKKLLYTNLFHFEEDIRNAIVDISYISITVNNILSLDRLVMFPDGITYHIYGSLTGLSIDKFYVPTVNDVINNVWTDDFNDTESDIITNTDNRYYCIYVKKANLNKSIIKRDSWNSSVLTYVKSLFNIDSSIFKSSIINPGDKVSYIRLVANPSKIKSGNYFKVSAYAMSDENTIVPGFTNETITLNYNGINKEITFSNGYGQTSFQATSDGHISSSITIHEGISSTGEEITCDASCEVVTTDEPMAIVIYPKRLIKNTQAFVLGYNISADINVGGANTTPVRNNEYYCMFNTPSIVPGERYSVENNIQLFSIADLSDIVSDNNISKLDVKVRRGKNNWRIDSYHFEVPNDSTSDSFRYPYTPYDFINLRGLEKPSTSVKYRYSPMYERYIEFPFYEYQRTNSSDAGYKDIVLHKFTCYVKVYEDIDDKYFDMINNMKLILSGGIFSLENRFNIFINGKEAIPITFLSSDTDQYQDEIDIANNFATSSQVHMLIEANFNKGWNKVEVITDNITPSVDKIRRNEIAPPSELLLEPTFLLYNTSNVNYVYNPDVIHNAYYNSITSEEIVYGGPVDLKSLELYVGNDQLYDMVNGTDRTGIFSNKNLEPMKLIELYAEKNYMKKVNKYSLFYKTPRINQNRYTLIDNVIVTNHIPITNYVVELYDMDYSLYPQKMYLECEIYNDDDRYMLTPKIYGATIDMEKY